MPLTTKTEFFPEPLNVPVSVAAGDMLAVDRLEAIEVQAYGTFNANIQLQISLDGVNWVDVGAVVSAPGTTTITNTARFLRADVTAFVAGVPLMIVDGRGTGSK